MHSFSTFYSMHKGARSRQRRLGLAHTKSTMVDNRNEYSGRLTTFSLFAVCLGETTQALRFGRRRLTDVTPLLVKYHFYSSHVVYIHGEAYSTVVHSVRAGRTGVQIAQTDDR